MKLLAGTPTAYVSLASTGTRVRRSFCPDCGTPLFSENEKTAAFIGIKTGALDHPENYPPSTYLWTASALPWQHIDPGVRQYRGNFPLFA